MIYTDKPIVQIILKGSEEDYCDKCRKTKQVIEKMFEVFPDFKEEVEILYKDVKSKEIIKKYGELKTPVVIVNDTIFSEGHVPIIKKLRSTILEFLK